MWPVELLQRRAARRRYAAAMAVLLSANAYAKLSPTERLRVDAEYSKLLGYAGIATVSFRRFAPWPARAIERGWAMARLGLSTQIPTIPWPEKFYRSFLAGGPGMLFFDFRRTSAETDEVAHCLRQQGAEIPSPLPPESSEDPWSDFLHRKPLPAEPWE